MIKRIVVNEVNDNKAKEYEVEIDKTISTVVNIVADSEEEARTKAWEMIDTQLLDYDDETAEYHIFVF